MLQSFKKRTKLQITTYHEPVYRYSVEKKLLGEGIYSFNNPLLTQNLVSKLPCCIISAKDKQLYPGFLQATLLPFESFAFAYKRRIQSIGPLNDKKQMMWNIAIL